jgi:hypothetical protein
MTINKVVQGIIMGTGSLMIACTSPPDRSVPLDEVMHATKITREGEWRYSPDDYWKNAQNASIHLPGARMQPYTQQIAGYIDVWYGGTLEEMFYTEGAGLRKYFTENGLDSLNAFADKHRNRIQSIGILRGQEHGYLLFFSAIPGWDLLYPLENETVDHIRDVYH